MIPIIKTKDSFGGQLFYINLSKRKAWNLLLREGGIIQPNKRYILHNGMIWHNNSLMSVLTSDGVLQ